MCMSARNGYTECRTPPQSARRSACTNLRKRRAGPFALERDIISAGKFVECIFVVGPCAPIVALVLLQDHPTNAQTRGECDALPGHTATVRQIRD